MMAATFPHPRMYTDWTAVALLLLTAAPLAVVVATAAFFIWKQKRSSCVEGGGQGVRPAPLDQTDQALAHLHPWMSALPEAIQAGAELLIPAAEDAAAPAVPAGAIQGGGPGRV